MRKLGLSILLGLVWAAPALAAAGTEAAEPDTVELDALEISAPKDTTERITQTEMERKIANTLWDALRGAPGVYQTQSTGRGEGTISIRGSDRYQVGMYIDGVPTATAYRNEWDFNNILTYDLESIEISKGYSSPLLQNNGGMAGVINVTTAKPKKAFEFKAKYLNNFDRDMKDQGRALGLTLGTRQDLFYLQGSFMYSDQDYFKLPAGFEAGRYEDGGKRLNSDFRNKRWNLMAGFTPTENIDFRFGYVRQRFEKGQPVDASKDAPNTGPGGAQTRLWRWPDYETDRYYLNADFTLGDKAELKFVGYYDKHKDASLDYTDIYFEEIAADSSRQTYDQYTAGGQVIFKYAFNDANQLGLSAGYRRLSHKEHRYPDNYGQNWTLWEEDKEDYYDFGAEYTWKPCEPLSLVLGATYTRLEPDTSAFRNSANLSWNERDKADKKNLFDYQAGVFYDLTEDHEIFFTFAHKSRVATMRERFTTDRNTGRLNNPDLDPEVAFHYELGYRGLLAEWLKFNSSVYYSHVKDKIVSIGTRTSPKYGNVDKANIWGLEIGTEALVSPYFSLGATMSLMEWETDTNHRDREAITDAPKAMGTLYAVITPLEGLDIVPELYMTSDFYSSANKDKSSTNRHPESPGFATLNLRVSYALLDTLTLEAGIKNLLDKEYYYNYGYPQAGRSMFAGITYKF